jgi:PST family polysaccharide transporter
MTLIKTGLLNGIAVGVRILSSLLLNKVLAVSIGPAGYALIGQFQNFMNMLTTLASGAINTGVAKYTAESYDDEARQVAVWKTAGTIALVGSATVGLIIIVLRRQLAVWVLKNETFAGVFVWLGTGLVLFTLNGLLLAILNGKKKINHYVAINIAGSLLGLAVTTYLAIWWGIFGALVALSVNQSILFIVTLCLCWREPWFQPKNFAVGLDPAALRSLGKYALMALTSAVCIPVSQILIRDHLGATFGWDAAGRWEALMRISSLYLMLVTTPLTVYYLPRLSEIRHNSELRQEISRGYVYILPVAAIGALTIYLLRDWIVLTMFTSAFAPMRELFAWQMLGDTAKIGSWLLAYTLIGRAMTKTFIFTEISFSVSWVCLVLLMTEQFGEQGTQIAYFVSYVAHWLVMFVLVKRKIQ